MTLFVICYAINHSGSMRHTRTPEYYFVSVLDSDGDRLLVDAHIQALDYQLAWQQAIEIAFRTCQGSGAMPMVVTVSKVKTFRR